MWRRTVCLVALTMLVAGCGGGDGGDEPDQGRADVALDAGADAGADVGPPVDVPRDVTPPLDVKRPDVRDVTPPDVPDRPELPGGDGDGAGPRCTRDEDCADLAPDPCTVARCGEDGRCVVEPRSCDDGDDCTFDVCNPASGLCDHSPNPECGCLTDADCPDDTNECTLPACRIPAGADFGICGFAASTTGCDDNNPCTAGEVCTAVAGPRVAVCAGGTATSCDDLDEGTLDWCDPRATPACRHQPLDSLPPCPGGQGDCPPPSGCVGWVCDADAENPLCRPEQRTGSCDDGNFCTVEDACTGGVCAGGAPRDCDDGNERTLDSCSPAAQACDHEDLAALTPCVTAQDCVTALGPPADTCRQWLCPQGYCRDVRVPEETSCDDGLFCTVDDSCRQGACTGGVPRDCDDGVPTTDCVCDEEGDRCACEEDYRCGTGCTTGSDCDDGDPCTTDSCATYLTPTACTCRPRAACHCDPASPDGGAAACDDGEADTEDACLPNADPTIPYAGLCEHVLRIVCDQPCAGADAAAACDDGQKCTVDLCEPSLDPEHPFCCIHPSQGPPCGRTCTQDADCADGVACTPDRCGADGSCDPPGAPLEDCCATDDDCPEDDNPCTARRCETSTGRCGFVNTTVTCDDGDECTVNDACDEGVCSGDPRDCSDGDDCTDDRCDPQQGCVSTRLADPPPECIDCRTNPSVCDDGDVCTNDVCTPSGRCTHEELNDGQDTPLCQRLGCRSEVDCDDGNPCTIDRCVPTPPDPDGAGPIVPAGGCQYAEDPTCAIQNAGSSHPLACTTVQDCDPADCQFDDPAAFCNNPSDDCPTAGCDRQTGCRFVPTAACPLNECTPATAWRDCFDWLPCTVDECDPETFECLPTAERRSTLPADSLLTTCRQCETPADCEGEVAALGIARECLTVECLRPALAPEQDNLGVCHAYVDQTLFPNACEDYELCTADVCVPGVGCSHAPIVPDCEVCYVDWDCDDGNPCTDDRCENGAFPGAVEGGLRCLHTPVAGCRPCADDFDCAVVTGSYCEGTELCKGGECIPMHFSQQIGQGHGWVCVPGTGCQSAADCGEVPGGLPVCSVDSGDCIYIPRPATCTALDQCVTTTPCERAVACTDGQCVFEPIPGCQPRACTSRADCDDATGCTIDWCNGGTCLNLGSECCLSTSDCADRLEPRPGDCSARTCAPDHSCQFVPVDRSVRCADRCETDADCTRSCEDRLDPDTGAVVGQRCQSFCLRAGTCSATEPCPFGACDLAPGATTGRCLQCFDWPCSRGACSAQGRCMWFDGDCTGCSADADCADPDPCTLDTCVAGACQHAPDPTCAPIACDADTLCDNGDLCSMGVCLSGACVFLPNPACE